MEIYLTEYVGKINCKVISPDIEDVALIWGKKQDGTMGNVISKVLSFNYSNTYERLYLSKQTGLLEEYMDYIHGRADITNTIESNNMVFGIDEYLTDDRRNRDIEFIAFKKFYQRIHKNTGCRYKDWVDDIREDAAQFKESHKYILNRLTSETNKGKYEEYRRYIHKVYVFGHSLDVTDGDVLRDLILNDNVYTTIYYFNKEQYGQQIANLVRVIGQDELIRRTGGSTKTIEFKLQRDMVERG